MGPPMRTPFGENVFKNERIGSRRGGHVPGMPPRSANGNYDEIANTNVSAWCE